MWLISRLRDQRFCAFCKAKRRVYVKKHIDLTNVLCAGAFALVTTFSLYASPDPRGIGIFGFYIMGAEIFVYMRWRLAIVCKMCGFDPVLYKKSPARANIQCKDFFKEQVDNPQFWLTRSPLLNIQKGIRLQEKKAIERQIIANRAKSSSLAPNKSV